MGIFDSYKKKKLLNDGIKLLNEEKYDASLEFFDKALELDPNYANAWYNKGFILFNIGNYNEANECFDKFLGINHENVHIFSTMSIKATTLFMLKKYPEQLELSNKLIAISKSSLERLFALNIKSNALLKLEQYDESEKIIDNILKEEPESESALANKATILSKHGNNQEAINYYENSIEIYNKKISQENFIKTEKYMVLPKEITNNILSEIWVNKGKTHQKQQETTKALECFNSALILNPEHKEAKKAIEETIIDDQT